MSVKVTPINRNSSSRIKMTRSLQQENHTNDDNNNQVNHTVTIKIY